MQIWIEDEVKSDFPFSAAKVAQDVGEAVLDAEDFPYDAEVSLTLTDAFSIQAMNRQQRGINEVTDVLSFPMMELYRPWAEQPLAEEMLPVNPDSGCVVLGDIVICVPRMQEQAAEYGHSLRREYAFLFAHSMLHLLGHDHINDMAREKMELRQDQILNTLGITRDLTE